MKKQPEKKEKSRPSRIIDLAGQRFGRLVAIGVVGTNKQKGKIWECVCDCGVVKNVSSGHLRSGDTTSCGCYHREIALRHGHNTDFNGKTLTYRSWDAMIQRCTNPKKACYHNYGGRGILVCDRWKNDFMAFLNDMGIRPSQKHTIDRIDTSGNYEPSNCRWATTKQQSRNRSNNKLTQDVVDSIRQSAKSYLELSKKYQVTADHIYRIKTNRAWLNEEGTM